MPTTPSSALRDDLAFIRRAVERSTPWQWPPAIACLWGVVVAAGFAVIDLQPQTAPLYWGVAAPTAFLASLWLGRRGAARRGQEDRRLAMVITMHWTGLLAAGGLAALAALAGAITWSVMAATMVLLSATVYYLAGVHGDRRLLWVAGALGLGYLAVLFLPRGAWTAAGLLFAVAVVSAAFLGRPGADDRR